MTQEDSIVQESNGVMKSREVLATEWKCKLESSTRLNRQREQGEVWALVDKKWFQQFEQYIEAEGPDAESARPGKIQNHDLLEGGDKLERDTDFPADPDWKHDLKRSEDSYVAVPSEVWEWLHKSFGGGPCIPRYCLESGPDNSVFDTPLTVYICMDKRHAKLIVPRSLEFHMFQAAAQSALKIGEADADKYHILTDQDVDLTAQVEASGETETLDSLNVADCASLEFTDRSKPTESAKPEVIPLGPARAPVQFDLNTINSKLNTQSKAVLPGTNALTNRPILSSLRAYEDRVQSTRGRVPGLAGLQNLGNTCFMNSALQCLFHCVPVLRTFLSGTFIEDLNVDNPLGKGGEMAKAFGSLLQKMWRGDVDYVSPEGFKHILGKHAVQFQSYDQHDSQEFLSYLLDMLHEDLNRVKKKPYIEEPDDEGRPDEEVAKESWDIYRYRVQKKHVLREDTCRARNDSAIVDHFQGLLKSTLDCPNCGHHKRKFDPFMYLSVPLPGNDTVLTEVTVVPMDGVSKPQLHCVKVFKNDTVGAFIEAMAIVLGIKVETAQQRLQAANVSLHNRVTLLDDMSADLPQKSRWSHDRLVVYSYPEVDAEEGGNQPSKKAVIMPPGSVHSSKSPLPLLLRVPGNAIELESETAPTGASMYSRSNKRYLLRPDCELARRVEDLLKPFKRLRSGTNLVYSPTASCPGQAADSTMTESPDGMQAPQGVGEGIEQGGRGSLQLDRDGDSPMLSADTGAAANGTEPGACGSGDSDSRAGPQPSSDAVEGVATATGAFSIQSPGKLTIGAVDGTPSWLMETSSAGSAGAGAANGELGSDSQSGKDIDTVQGVPADEPAAGIPCPTSRGKGMVKGLLGGQEFDTTTAVPAAAQAPSPPSPPHAKHTGASVAPSDSIIGAVPAPEPLDLRANHASPVAESVGGQTETGGDLGAAAAEASDGKQPAVRLMVVTDAGYQIGFAPQADADTRFFKLDVPLKEVVDLFDVDAMSQVERHDSMAQLDIRNEYSLEDCITAYLASEVLGPRDTWHCPKCRQDVRAKKALDLWCLPEVLIIHLKRFSYSGSGYYSTMSSKIDNSVDFPLKGLDMTKFVHPGNDEEAIYDCFGVSNHMGSVSGGHYTAYCAHERSLCTDGQKSSDWNCYNDRSVVTTTPGSVVTSSAYVLFYRRQSKSEADPDRLVQQCKDQLQKDYAEQAAAAMGEEPVAGGVPCTTSPSNSADAMDSQAARAMLGDGLIDSNPLPPALQAALSPSRPADESMSGGDPYTPEPNAISLENPTPITSSQSDGIPPPDETEMKTFGMSTAGRMEETMHGAGGLEPQDIASDIADLSDVGEAPEPGLSVYSQGDATSEDGNDGLVNDSSISNDDAGSPGGTKVDSVKAWLHGA